MFSTLSHKGHDFQNKVTEHDCVFQLSLQLVSETFFILRRNERDMIKKMYIVFYVKYLLFLSDFFKET